MARKSKMEDEVSRIAEEVATSLGLEIYDVLLKRTGPRWKLQVFVTGPDANVNLDDCARLSRQLSRELDLFDPIPHGYDLEVSSPGLDRSLRTIRHFAQAKDRKVRVRWRDANGKVNETVGTVTHTGDGTVTLQLDADPSPVEIDFAAILSARLQAEVNW